MGTTGRHVRLCRHRKTAFRAFAKSSSMPEVAHAQRDSGTATPAPRLPRARRLLLAETDRGRTTGPLSLRIVEIPIASRLHLRSLRSPLRSTRVTDPVTQRLGVAMKFG